MRINKIQWLNLPGYQGETWNPLLGCRKISEGCANCYAETQANIRAGNTKTCYRHVITNGNWNGESHLAFNALDKPFTWKKPRVVFVCSMGDLFFAKHSFQDIDRVFTSIACNPQHLFIVLTKRPKRMSEYLNDPLTRSNLSYNILKSKNNRFAVMDPLQDSAWPLKNLWIGVTAENQEQANFRIPFLLNIPAAIRFFSNEPALGPINFTKIPMGDIRHDSLTGYGEVSADYSYSNDQKLDWVIVGGESGHKARPIHPEWVRSVRDQCAEANTPFFFKQWGEYKPISINRTGIQPYNSKSNPYTLYTNKAGDIFELVDKDAEFLVCGDSDNEYYQAIQKVGKKHSGNLLDGKKYEAYPDLTS